MSKWFGKSLEEKRATVKLHAKERGYSGNAYITYALISLNEFFWKDAAASFFDDYVREKTSEYFGAEA